LASGLAGLCKDREENRRKDGNDGDDYQKFN
jgi:hypothetical protein